MFSLITIFPPPFTKMLEPITLIEAGSDNTMSSSQNEKAKSQIVSVPSGTMYSFSLNPDRAANSRFLSEE